MKSSLSSLCPPFCFSRTTSQTELRGQADTDSPPASPNSVLPLVPQGSPPVTGSRQYLQVSHERSIVLVVDMIKKRQTLKLRQWVAANPEFDMLKNDVGLNLLEVCCIKNRPDEHAALLAHPGFDLQSLLDILISPMQFKRSGILQAALSFLNDSSFFDPHEGPSQSVAEQEQELAQIVFSGSTNQSQMARCLDAQSSVEENRQLAREVLQIYIDQAKKDKNPEIARLIAQSPLALKLF